MKRNDRSRAFSARIAPITASVTCAYWPCRRDPAYADRVGGHAFDGFHQAVGCFLLAEMLQHHDRRPERADGIGDVLSHDVRPSRESVSNMENSRSRSLRLAVGAMPAILSAAARSENVGVQVGGDDHCRSSPAFSTMRIVIASTIILSQVTSEISLRDLGRAFVPMTIATLRVGRHTTVKFAWARLRQPEGKTDDA